MPLALSDGGDAAAASGVLEAARCWRKMRPAQAQGQAQRQPSRLAAAGAAAAQPTCVGTGATSWTLPRART